MTPTKPICFPIYEIQRGEPHGLRGAINADSCQMFVPNGRVFFFSPRVSWGSELPRAGTCIHQLPEVRGRLVQLRQVQLEGRKLDEKSSR